MSQQDLLTGAAFVMDGLLDATKGNIGRLIASFEQPCGYIELIQEATSYVPFMCEEAYRQCAIWGEYPGVFDYEVSIEFGKWFANESEELRGPPDVRKANEWIVQAVYAFFTQGLAAGATACSS